MAKLNKAEKSYRKELKAEVIRRNGFVANAGRVTVAVIPTFGKNGKFAVSICSESDKFKREQGEMIAMQRLFVSGGLPCVFPRHHMAVFAFIADICGVVSSAESFEDPCLTIGEPMNWE